MALIRINKESVWKSAAFLFESVLKRASEMILPVNGAFGKKLEDSIYLTFLSLEDASEQDLRLFLQAVREIESTYAQAGAASFADPSFYPGFMARLEDLRLLLTADSRSECTK